MDKYIVIIKNKPDKILNTSQRLQGSSSPGKQLIICLKLMPWIQGQYFNNSICIHHATLFQIWGKNSDLMIQNSANVLFYIYTIKSII